MQGNRKDPKSCSSSVTNSESSQSLGQKNAANFKAPDYFEDRPVKLSSYMILLFLLLIFIMNQFDVFLLSYMKLSMQESILFTDSEYGFLMGYGTSAIYSLFSIVFGYVADLANCKKAMLLGGLLFWSASMVAQGFCKQFWHLLLAKIGLGLGLAMSTPSMFSMLPHLFPPSFLPQADSILYYGIYIGVGASSFVGGVLSDVDGFGWRKTLCAAGAFGGLLVLVGYFVLSPERFTKSMLDSSASLDFVTGTKPRVAQTFFYILSLSSFWRLLFAAGFRLLSGFSFGAYVPAYLKSSFPHRKQNVNITYGVIVLAMGITASHLGGWLSSRYSKRFPGAGLVIAGVGSLGTIPFVILMMYSPQMFADENLAFVFTFVFMALAYLFAETWLGPTTAVVQFMFPASFLTTGYAFFTTVTYFVGASGPEIIGFLLTANRVNSWQTGLTRNCILWVIVGSYFISALWFFSASRYVLQDYNTKFSFQPSDSPIDHHRLYSSRICLFTIGLVCFLLVMITLIVISFLY